jgi:SpoVK/Ycf46/Vps4 family AAA+-type ATPase
MQKGIVIYRSEHESQGSFQLQEGNVNLLFWGRPGTGKTEMAKYLADQLGLELMLKRASDLISMWVGKTEKLIREAFAEAERDSAILFIDEADSFFINRQAARHSWEISQTNELLTQMENHKGILICCTNLLEHLDQAVLRRFVWKIHFQPLTADGKLRVLAVVWLQYRLLVQWLVFLALALFPDSLRLAGVRHSMILL